MSCGTGNTLITGGIGLNQAPNRDSVCVISDCETDAEYVSGLLRQSGYRTQSISDVPTLQNANDTTKFTNKGIATVVCHRKSTACLPLSLVQHLPGKKIIVLSDCDSEQTVVSLLNSGAQYFFNLGESDAILQVRLEAALRQSQKIKNESFAVGDLYFDADKRVVTKQGEVVDLSPREFDLAYYLFLNRDRMVVNSEIMTSIWSLPPTMDTRRIDTAACHLRKKLKLNIENDWLLKRSRTIGYRLIPVDRSANTDTSFEKHPFDEPLRAAVG